MCFEIKKNKKNKINTVKTVQLISNVLIYSNIQYIITVKLL